MNGTAEIRISFAKQVRYLRHTPPGKGKVLNVFVEIPGQQESEIVEETLVAPQTDLVPRFSIAYPKLGSAMAITFDAETSWEVRPGSDSRSILVVVPVLRGARDFVVESRAPVSPPPAPKAVAAKPAAPAAPAPVATTPAAAVATTPPPQPVAAEPTAPPVTETATPIGATVEGAPTAPAMTSQEIENLAKGFYDEAMKALEERDLVRAINRFNRTLGLPPNAQTESAQAMIGEVRELNGEIAKAKAEYDLYLKLYPNGVQVARIRERLEALPKEGERPKAAARRSRPLKRGPAEWTTYGSLAQYYYTGKSQIEITTPPPPGLLDFTTDKLSMTDQNALITNVDMNARRRDGITDSRIVVRGANTHNYLNSSRSYSRLYSAYVEQSDRELGYFVRAGRQTPNGGGVMERFDGVNVGYNFADRWRVNGVAGYAVEFMSPYDKNFYGISVDMQPTPEQFGFTGYVIQQRMDGFLNRQAVGLETRYFDMNSTLYGMLDYDTLYKGVNIAMLQGNYRSDDGTNYFTYIDHRKTPPYGLTNALPGLAGLSIQDAINTLGIQQVRADAKALTATSNMLAIGLTHPWSPHWMLGADYRAASISSTQATATIPAMPGSGTNHVISLQAIGNNLLETNDVAVINTSYIKGATYNGQALGGNYVYLYNDAWRFDLALRYYTQKDNQDQKQDRISPSFKIGYRWEPVTLEAEIGAENVTIDGPLSSERSNRRYLFLGYRLDLR